MTGTTQTLPGHDTRPQHFVRRGRWAGSRISPALIDPSYASDASPEASST